MYTINHLIKGSDHGKERVLTLKLGVTPIDKLLLHEATIDEPLNALKESLGGPGPQIHPIIVDEKSLVILDGMHRTIALKDLGFKYIAVQLVDGMDESISLEKWYRIIHGQGREVMVEDLTELGVAVEELDLGLSRESGAPEKNFEICEAQFSKYNESMEQCEGIGVLVDINRDRCFLLRAKKEDIKNEGYTAAGGGITGRYNYVGLIENYFIEHGFRVAHKTRKNAIESISDRATRTKEHCRYVLIPPRITKEQAFEVAMSKDVFIPKSTRFVLPARALFMNTPKELLREHFEKDPEIKNGEYKYEAILKTRNEIIEKELSKKKVYVLKGDRELDRHYEEPYLYSFEPLDNFGEKK